MDCDWEIIDDDLAITIAAVAHPFEHSDHGVIAQASTCRASKYEIIAGHARQRLQDFSRPRTQRHAMLLLILHMARGTNPQPIFDDLAPLRLDNFAWTRST